MIKLHIRQDDPRDGSYPIRLTLKKDGQLFAFYYDGLDGRSNSESALRVWVEAVSLLGGYYFEQFQEGQRNAIKLLEIEESNLLYGFQTAYTHQW